MAKALSVATNPGSALTSQGVVLGTPAYMSPEQAAADPATDHRTDLYAVGAMAYEMLTGHHVFSERSPQAMLAAHAVERPEPIDKRRYAVPPTLASLVMRSLEKHAADRPQSAEDMLTELEAAVTTSGAPVPTSAPPMVVTGPPRRKLSARNDSWSIGVSRFVVRVRCSRPSRPSFKPLPEGSTNAVAVIPL